MSVKWMPVLNHEQDYEVSSEGQVRRVSPGRGARAGHILKPYVTPLGYAQIVLRKEGKSASRLICQLVCESFHGPRPTGMEVRHLDGDSLHDTPENLEWATHAVNVRDNLIHGTNFNAFKTHCKNGHEFTPENTLVRISRATGRDGRRCRECTLAISRRCKAVARERRRAA